MTQQAPDPGQVPAIPAGMYPDPHDPSALRYWDGTAWAPDAPPATADVEVAIPDAVPAVIEVAAEEELLRIGDIAISQHWIVTPNGTAPLKGSHWIVTDQSTVTTRIPSWAIVCCVLFFLLCFLGLLFLAVREREYHGYVQVEVRSGDLFHLTQMPVIDASSAMAVRQQVGQAQQLAYAA